MPRFTGTSWRRVTLWLALCAVSVVLPMLLRRLCQRVGPALGSSWDRSLVEITAIGRRQLAPSATWAVLRLRGVHTSPCFHNDGAAPDAPHTKKRKVPSKADALEEDEIDETFTRVSVACLAGWNYLAGALT
mgnify:FL=1